MHSIAKLPLSFAIALTLMTPFVHQATAANPFPGMTGYWRGPGTAVMANGAKEKLRCKAYYNASGNGSGIGLALTCASPGNKIEMRATLNYARGTVTGTWEERTFNATGQVSGKANESAIRLKINGAITGSLSIALTQSRQRVKLSASGGGLSSVNISLRR